MVAQGGIQYSWSKLSLMASFGQQLRRLRRDRRLTQRVLAERLGVDRRTLQRYELGQMFPAPEILAALVEALEVRVEDLFTLAPPLPRDPHGRRAVRPTEPGGEPA
ncbi:MAG TPA: helix-turn-helix transcriptional regulator [Thermoanaerobaculia bacterium]|nr:helix-turn-helix transcriptional regulator [Thermoanaerobaculia bacterium]